jgi:hypothetical protein
MGILNAQESWRRRTLPPMLPYVGTLLFFFLSICQVCYPAGPQAPPTTIIPSAAPTQIAATTRLRSSKQKESKKEAEWRSAHQAFGNPEDPSIGMQTYALMKTLDGNRTVSSELEGPQLPKNDTALEALIRQRMGIRDTDRKVLFLALFCPLQRPSFFRVGVCTDALTCMNMAHPVRFHAHTFSHRNFV